jgi:hypothetical protein
MLYVDFYDFAKKIYPNFINKPQIKFKFEDNLKLIFVVRKFLNTKFKKFCRYFSTNSTQYITK